MNKDMEKWSGIYMDYKEIEGMQIPHYVEVTWNLVSGDSTYAKFRLDKVEYNNPYRFT